ncbi:hypothetical protein [Nitrosospira sp. Is2]|uniref:hypothetical protein n=1 Tax=Nitrosospira sp. Is2 TaxID=3080532 RepID=UPI00295421F8|nr:hypothetical protein [Nitrosospira sp. Is2]WON74464.1 hypothetical protein R5L00_02940 [Nitrosospira sp. Is2]
MTERANMATMTARFSQKDERTSIKMDTPPSKRITLESGDGIVGITFDLKSVKMTEEQQAIVEKLFSQEPIAVVTEEDHTYELEKNKEGPARKYLTQAEFESIRQLGVRLGTKGELKAAQCDFCLHCVKLEALPEWNAGIS